MKTTSNLGLMKPEGTDVVDIENFNTNADTLDTTIGAMSTVPTTAKNIAGAIKEIHTAMSNLDTTISDGEITTAKLADSAVTTIKLAANAVTGAKMANSTVTATQLADGAVTSAKLADSGVSAGTYKSVTVDGKGRVTAGSNPTTLSGYGITDAAPLASPALTGTPTAPTAAVGVNTTQIANTAFVRSEVGDRSNLLTTTKTNVVAAVNELFQSVGDGKTAIASAITGKGVQSTGSDTFAQLASKIGSIKVGISNWNDGAPLMRSTGGFPYYANVFLSGITDNDNIAAWYSSGSTTKDTDLLDESGNIKAVTDTAGSSSSVDMCTVGNYVFTLFYSEKKVIKRAADGTFPASTTYTVPGNPTSAFTDGDYLFFWAYMDTSAGYVLYKYNPVTMAQIWSSNKIPQGYVVDILPNGELISYVNDNKVYWSPSDGSSLNMVSTLGYNQRGGMAFRDRYTAFYLRRVYDLSSGTAIDKWPGVTPPWGNYDVNWAFRTKAGELIIGFGSVVYKVNWDTGAVIQKYSIPISNNPSARINRKTGTIAVMNSANYAFFVTRIYEGGYPSV
ncbi:hypothetical protein PghCCS26_23600 [Paenibacillus glycanilyticus]|uniref:Tail fiber protein n=1 Tax=Paenibacillus glycanilyticus TaxID=126569 RepID=A0ABQ6NLX8_9BACL|nr:hypothetical protein [Paenibacillus glycanilyticus]GMK45232.1 hypothetical protein PghCCS26_23600 [Paenibacillus glycanilyticus]